MGEDRNGDPLIHETPTIIRPKGPNYRGAMICFLGVVIISLVGMVRVFLESNSIIYAVVTGAILFAVAAASIARRSVSPASCDQRGRCASIKSLPQGAPRVAVISASMRRC